MRIRLMLAGVVVGTAAGIAASKARDWWRTWGADPDEAARILPGDDVVPDPVASETRGITIDAPPDRVWPWLVQMGYGKAGWYSYDRLDQRGKSADAIVDAWQGLEVGAIVPTHPGGGFEVVSIDPGRSLVLRSDTALVKEQAEAWEAARAAALSPTRTTEAETVDALDADAQIPAGLSASSAILGQTPQQFSASWTFVVEPLGDRRSRLIERFRVWYGESGMASHVVMPVVGFGVFVMMQRQMVGIKARAERLFSEASGTPVTSVTIPVMPEVKTNGRDRATEGPELATATVD